MGTHRRCPEDISTPSRTETSHRLLPNQTTWQSSLLVAKMALGIFFELRWYAKTRHPIILVFFLQWNNMHTTHRADWRIKSLNSLHDCCHGKTFNDSTCKKQSNLVCPTFFDVIIKIPQVLISSKYRLLVGLYNSEEKKQQYAVASPAASVTFISSLLSILGCNKVVSPSTWGAIGRYTLVMNTQWRDSRKPKHQLFHPPDLLGRFIRFSFNVSFWRS